MKDTDIKEKYNSIVSSTISKNLKNAFNLLTELLALTHKPEWNDKKNELEQNYMYLLQYAMNGVNDPEQEQVYNKIRLSLLQLADQAYNAAMTSGSDDYPYIQKRVISKVTFPSLEEIDLVLSKKDSSDSINELLKDSNISHSEAEVIDTQRDDLVSLIFQRLWLKAVYAERETTLVDNIIYSDETLLEDKCLIVSAIMLSLMLQFDEKKFDLIINIISTSNGIIQDRAFIALIINCSLYANRLVLYPTLTKKINNLATKPWFKEKFITTILLFINGLETEKINKELTNEIIPDLFKQTDKIDINSLINKNNTFSENPEWENIMGKWDFSDKIQRFADLQKNGADVFLSTFASMKNHPFFWQICNWFRPYNTKNSWVKREFKGKSYKLFDLISLNPIVCDSDRYSMLFSLSTVPEDYIKNIENGLQLQDEQIKQIKEENQFLGVSEHEKLAVQLYWQDLYRFFKLHPNHTSFIDPYTNGLEIVNMPFLNDMEGKTLCVIADAYIKKKFYSEALVLLKTANLKDANDLSLLQKIGFCYQKTGRYEEAINYYKRADIISSKNDWLDKMLAFCYMKNNEFEKALPLYQKLSDANPDNMNAVVNTANCLIGLQRYTDALPLLFKVEYLAPNIKVYRSIAWCAFIVGKFDQSRNYIEKIESESRTTQDWITLGHILWCQNNKNEAIKYYSIAAEKESDKKNVITLIQNDISLLSKNGITKEDIPLVMDRIRYSIGLE